MDTKCKLTVFTESIECKSITFPFVFVVAFDVSNENSC